MQGHYTFIGELIKSEDLQKFLTAAAIGLSLVAIGVYVHRKLRTPQQRAQHLVPRRFTLLSFLDFTIESFLRYHDEIVGPEYRKYASFSGSIFIFLLLCNYIGVIPGMAAPTTSVWVNLGVAVVVFIYFNYLGVRHNGLVGYLRHFAGPILPLAVLIFPVEVFSTVLRVFTLNLRLYWNITADHIVMATFTGLAPLIGIVAYILAMFVAFMQAFIFTTLTMVYIQLAVQHEEEH